MKLYTEKNKLQIAHELNCKFHINKSQTSRRIKENTEKYNLESLYGLLRDIYS